MKRLAVPQAPRVAVFAPTALLTVTIEDGARHPEVHLHAGGQGVWLAHMAAALGAEVALATVLGGEAGQVLGVLLQAPGITVHAIESSAANGVYVHDRRSGKRVALAQVPAPRLSRHVLDKLYGVAVVDGLGCRVACLTGPQHRRVLQPSVYGRLAGDLRRDGVTVLADLTGAPLEAALAGSIDVLKLSEAELISEGWVHGTGVHAISDGLKRLKDAGARTVIASRAAAPALVLTDAGLFELRGPRFTAADPAGTGDAMVAAIAVALARGDELVDALALGAAAGAINATRHGLGTGGRSEIEALARRVAVQPLAGDMLIDDISSGRRA